MRIRGKRGMLDIAIDLMLFLIIGSLIVIYIFPILGITGNTKDVETIRQDMGTVRVEQLIGVFLKSPLSSRHGTTGEELLVWSHLNNDFDEFEETAYRFFDEEIGKNGWRFSSNLMVPGNADHIDRIDIGKGNWGTSGSIKVETIVPLPKRQDQGYLKIVLGDTRQSRNSVAFEKSSPASNTYDKE